MESNQEKVEGLERDTEKQTSELPRLDEFNWRKCYPGDPFDNLLADIAEFGPPN